MGRDFRIDRKDDEGEKEMNRPDVSFGVERESSGRRNGGKVKGRKRNGRFTRGGRRSGTGMVGKRARRELVMVQRSSKGEMRGNAGEGDNRIGGEGDGVESGRTRSGGGGAGRRGVWTDGNGGGGGWRRWRWWCDDLAAAAVAAA